MSGGCLWLMTTLGVDSEDWRTYTQTSARCGRGASTGRDVCLTNGQKLSLVKALEWLHCAVTTALTNGSTAPGEHRPMAALLLVSTSQWQHCPWHSQWQHYPGEHQPMGALLLVSTNVWV